ncbi:type II toxin-antitoxin system RelE/ParE family toxin [Yersinia enterocolitica]|nr:type II toxin-antitoxin system RelE/ParE family toxin [Yersinia enterocolitica]EKN3797504.1 type II toxin-antitoxin system RelE/ParE family toxin [Yersinia enterocolitica]EKN3878392.1 type II toxin-antitoxin system RelE/ParE family toxin [Yersinia enterocolitica]EKN4175972.1 type II toxin-antitoxin system RelE/ParE family toxin [Yersinia enterocolitica]EKN6089120.1 addiction module toxin RelE [Yersinia enterocolitica]
MDFLQFIETPFFSKQRDILLTEDEFREFQQVLLLNPSSGALIVGTGGVRKVRFAIGQKGKSGGVRVIYYYQEPQGRIWLFTVYPKNQKDTLTSSEKQQFKDVIIQIKGSMA